MTRHQGHDAIEIAEAKGLTLSKHADPIEDAREGLSIDEAREIAAEDPGLIYVDVEDRDQASAHGFIEDAEVEAGAEGTDGYDAGRVIEVDGDEVTVAWSSGVRTTQHYSLLRLA